MLRHPDPGDSFWQTPEGGIEYKDAVKNARFPLLLVTGFYDVFAEGVLRMWEEIPKENRKNCALAVTAYNHALVYNESESAIRFERGSLEEVCADYALNWFESIRKNTPPCFVRRGETTYYSLFEGIWYHEPFLSDGYRTLTLFLGDGSLDSTAGEEREITYPYNPDSPAEFRGGVNSDFGGMAAQDPVGSRSDILSFLSPLFTESRRFKGRIRAELCVRSDREDTCFYIRLSVVKNGVAYSLRDDIMSLRLSSPDYHPGEEAVLCFSCAPLSFRIEEGERLRLDVSSSDFPHYSVHTNRPGLQADMAEAICSNNTVICGKSALFLPFE